MIGVREFVEEANAWGRNDYAAWLSAGLFELAAPSKDGLPFHPLFIVPTQEPLGQLHQAIKLAPGRIRGAGSKLLGRRMAAATL